MNFDEKKEETTTRPSPNNMANSEIMNVVSLIGYNMKERMYKVKFKY